MPKNKKITGEVLIDGNSLYARAYYSIAPGGVALDKKQYHYHQKDPTKAGFVAHRMMLMLQTISSILDTALYAKGISSYKVIIFWDKKNSRKLRRKVYHQYKENRHRPRDDGVALMDGDMLTDTNGQPVYDAYYVMCHSIKKGFRDMAMSCMIEMDLMEADDLIALRTLWNDKRGVHSIIVSSDSDMYQLAGDTRIIIAPRTNNTLVFTNAHPAKLDLQIGINIPDFTYYLPYKIICGDSSDNWPGFKGYGTVKAAKFVTDNDLHTGRPFKEMRKVVRHKLGDEAERTFITGYKLVRLPFPMHFAKEDKRSMMKYVDSILPDKQNLDWDYLLEFFKIKDDHIHKEHFL